MDASRIDGGLIFRPAEVDFAEAGDGGDKGWLEFVAEAPHFRESEFEGGGHILARHVAGSEDELADGVFFESLFFEEIVPDAFVRGQQDPAFRTDQREPCFIERSPLKVVNLALEEDIAHGQCVQDCAGVAEIFVEVEDEVVRRRRGGGALLPNGWLLRFAALCSHILRPDC